MDKAMVLLVVAVALIIGVAVLLSRQERVKAEALCAAHGMTLVAGSTYTGKYVTSAWACRDADGRLWLF